MAVSHFKERINEAMKQELDGFSSGTIFLKFGNRYGSFVLDGVPDKALRKFGREFSCFIQAHAELVTTKANSPNLLPKIRI